MPKKNAPEFSYDEKTGLYRKRIKDPRGKWVAVYGRTKDELRRKVKLREEEHKKAVELANSPTVYEYAAEWYRRRTASNSQQMKDHYARQLDKVILPVIGDRRMASITTDDIAEVMVTRATLGRSAQRDTVQTLKQLFGAALDAGIIDRDPTRTLKAGGKKPKPKKALTPAQEQQLLEAVAGTRAELFVKLGLYTGMRREEICALLWDSVDLDSSAPNITVQRAVRWPTNSQPEISDELKSEAAARTIPIPTALSEPLRALRSALPEEGIESRPVVCDTQGGLLSYSSLQSLWGIVRRRSVASGDKVGDKVRNHKITVTLGFTVTPHILRHTYITRLILGGMDLKRVQYLAGHADAETTIQIYTDLMGHQPEDLYDDVEAIFSPKTGDKN